MPTRNIVITDHQAQLVEQLVTSGRYQNASEVLRLVELQEVEYVTKLKALHDAIQLGKDDIAAGRFKTFKSGQSLTKHLNALADKTIGKVLAE